MSDVRPRTRETVATVQVDMLEDGTYVALFRRDDDKEVECWGQSDSIPTALSALSDSMRRRAMHAFDPRRPRPT